MTGQRLLACSFAFLLSALASGTATPAHTPLPGLPAVAEDQLFTDDRGQWSIASQRFTALLQRRFPPGYSESRLAQTLLDQGFQYLPPPKPGCVRDQDVPKMPIGKTFVPCPVYDVHRTLVYVWRPTDLPATAQMFCGQHLSVAWQAKGGKLTTISGHYDMLCP
jgi:hypothetical protein